MQQPSQNGKGQSPAVTLPPGTQAWVLVAVMPGRPPAVILPMPPDSYGDICFLGGVLESAKLQVLGMEPVPPKSGLVLPAGPMPPLRE